MKTVPFIYQFLLLLVSLIVFALMDLFLMGSGLGAQLNAADSRLFLMT